MLRMVCVAKRIANRTYNSVDIEYMILLNNDCLEAMKNIDDKSIDMILCDLPYGTTACKWDRVIPFKPLWEQYERIIKNNGAILLFGSEPFSSLLRTSNLALFKYDWIWEKSKPTGFAMAKNQPLRNYENIMTFSKGVAIHKGQSKRRMHYDPQGLVECYHIKKQGDGWAGTNTCMLVRPSHKKEHIQTQTNYPRQILKFNSASKTIHPTQKPVALLEYLIKTYTNKNELVLDNCMGSGSTGVACINTKRQFIGIEKEKKYFDIAKKRIEKHDAQLQLGF